MSSFSEVVKYTNVAIETDESILIERFHCISPGCIYIHIVRTLNMYLCVYRHDPDILLGYEVTMMSWGYLIDRAAHLNLNLTNQLSRTPRKYFPFFIKNSTF